MTDMDKIQKDNAEPGKAPDKMSADKLHLFATQYAFIDGRLHEAEQAMLKFMLEFRHNMAAYHSALQKRRNSMTTTSPSRQPCTGSTTRPVSSLPMST